MVGTCMRVYEYDRSQIKCYTVITMFYYSSYSTWNNRLLNKQHNNI